MNSSRKGVSTSELLARVQAQREDISRLDPINPHVEKAQRYWEDLNREISKAHASIYDRAKIVGVLHKLAEKELQLLSDDIALL